MASPYEILGVDADADARTIKRAYVRLIKKYKPDRDPERFAEIRGAYERLRSQRDNAAQMDSAPPAVETVDTPLELEVPQLEEPQETSEAPNEVEIVTRPGPEIAPAEGEDFVAAREAAVSQALFERKPRLVFDELRHPGWYRCPDGEYTHRFLVYRTATALVWMAPELFDELDQEFGHMLNDPHAHHLELTQMLALKPTWYERVRVGAVHPALVDLVELAYALEGDWAGKLVQRFSAARDLAIARDEPLLRPARLGTTDPVRSIADLVSHVLDQLGDEVEAPEKAWARAESDTLDYDDVSELMRGRSWQMLPHALFLLAWGALGFYLIYSGLPGLLLLGYIIGARYLLKHVSTGRLLLGGGNAERGWRRDAFDFCLAHDCTLETLVETLREHPNKRYRLWAETLDIPVSMLEFAVRRLLHRSDTP